MDSTVICAAAREEGIEMYTTTIPEAFEIVKQLREDFKEHYCNPKTKRDEYLLSKANLGQNVGIITIGIFVFIKERGYQHKNFMEYKYQSHGKRRRNT